MKLEVFTELCRKTSMRIGKEEFRLEECLLETGTGRKDGTNSFIPGEVRVAVSIRMLAGGSYLDLVPLFDVSTSGLYVVLGDFLEWTLLTFEFPQRGH